MPALEYIVWKLGTNQAVLYCLTLSETLKLGCFKIAQKYGSTDKGLEPHVTAAMKPAGHAT